MLSLQKGCITPPGLTTQSGYRQVHMLYLACRDAYIVLQGPTYMWRHPETTHVTVLEGRM